MHDSNTTSTDHPYQTHPGKLETVAKVAAEAVGIPAAEQDGSDEVQPSDPAYHQHPANAYHPTGPVHDLGDPGTPVKGGIVSGKLKYALGTMTSNTKLKAEGLDDEALALERSGKQSHNVEEMKATRDKSLELHRKAQVLRDAQAQRDLEGKSAAGYDFGLAPQK